MTKKVTGVLYADGWDNCLIGHATQATASGVFKVAVYSAKKIIDAIASEAAEADAKNGTDVMEREYYLGEAEEFFDFNIMQAYIGLGHAHPIFLCDHEVDIEEDVDSGNAEVYTA
ncbi:hypothetical protein UFOVP1336_7 [uncultured Caudovirales phage]|uniref:Uncharacterized protein n=1 Tax=uncultured Caudovirales phage TaxID=2100421 RepID=A0A6J5S266_9CAUD|nr:hypothetical protein UFOVP1336_7 [uncultured Caudovirales phage]